MKKEILRQLELMKKEALEVEENARNSSQKNNSRTDYAFMFGYAVAACKSSVVRIDTIIELIKQTI